MNYIELINAFWEKSEDENLTSGDVSVFFGLLAYANRLGWKNPFVCHWDIVCNYAKVSKNTYYKSMQTLHDLGYIDFQIGQKNVSKPKVSILNFKNNIENNIENRKGIEVEQNEEQNEEQKGNLDKLLNLQTIKPINLKTNTIPRSRGTVKKKFSELSKDDFDGVEKKYFVYAKGFYKIFSEHAAELNLPTKNLENANAIEWVKQIRLMLENNECTEEQLVEVGKFLQTDSFWKPNVRSVPKLREKFENIYSSTKKVKYNEQTKSTLEDPEFQAMVMAKFAAARNKY